MAEYIVQGESLTAIADEIRELSGTTATMGLDAMADNIGEVNEEVSNQVELIAQITSALENKTVGSQQATPIISVSSNGLITATAETKSSIYQLAFQPAKTITPTTTNQIAVSSGYYTGGNVIVKGDSNLVASNIVSGKSIFGIVGTATAGTEDDPFAIVPPPFTYTVDTIDGASYGFIKNNSGYYESQNKGQDSTYAICRVNLIVNETCDIIFDVINYAEGNFDYAIFGTLDTALTLSNTADSTVKESFKGKQSDSIVNVTYSGITAGSHYIDIKFIKDSSRSSNNDSVQFKIQEQNSLSQETINKILAADDDLKAENIKRGVEIFGINGILIDEDVFITRTFTSCMNSRVSYIANCVFCSCDSLTTANFPAATTIGSYAFEYCSKLTTVSFPVATTIGNHAFDYCYGLTTVSFPAATSIGSYAFRSCLNLTTVSFPAATSIGSYAFYDCSNLTTASFPAATTIGDYAFAKTNFTTADFPAATTIGSYAFEYCYNLTTVSFPNVTTIYNSAFYSCSKLTTVNFPVATMICPNAFRKCYSLTTASFPNVTSIKNSAFSTCYNLISLYLTGSNLCTLSNSDAFTSTPIGGYSTSAGAYGNIYVPASLLTSYQTATNWTYFSSRFIGI